MPWGIVFARHVVTNMPVTRVCPVLNKDALNVIAALNASIDEHQIIVETFGAWTKKLEIDARLSGSAFRRMLIQFFRLKGKSTFLNHRCCHD